MGRRHFLSVVSLSLAVLFATAPAVFAQVMSRRLVGHKGEVWAVAFRPDGKVLASGGEDNLIILWDAVTGKKLDSWKAPGVTIHTLAFSPDGKRLASASFGGPCLWDLATKTKLELPLTVGDKPFAWRGITFSPDSKTLALAGDSRVRFVDAATGKQISEAMHGGYCAAYSPDGETVVLGFNATTSAIRLLELKTGRLKWTSEMPQNVLSAAFHPDGNALAAGHAIPVDGVTLRDAATGGVLAQFKTAARVVGLAFTRDGKTLAGSCGTQLMFWDVPASKPIGAIPADMIKQIAMHPDGHIVAAAGKRAVWLYPVMGREVGVVERPKSEFTIKQFPRDLLASPSGKLVCWVEPLSVNWRTLDEKAAEETLPLSSLRSPQTEVVTFDKDEQGLIVASVMGRDTGPPGPPGGVRPQPRAGAAFSPDLKTFAVGGAEVEFHRIDLKTKKMTPLRPSEPRKGGLKEPLPLEGVRLWDIATGKEEERLEGHAKAVHCVAYSRSGKLIASLGVDGELRVWDLATNKTTWRAPVDLTIHRDLRSGSATPAPSELAFAAGDRILAVSLPEAVTLFDVAAGKETARLDGHTADITRIAVSPDGKLLASAALDGTILLWDAAKGERKAVFRASGPVHALAFTPDGKTLLADGASRFPGASIRLWDVAGGLAAFEKR